MKDHLAEPFPKGSKQLPVQRFQNGSCLSEQDAIAEEQPVALVYNGISHAVMLATPNNLEEFALGFSLSEGIVADPKDVYDIDVEGDPQGNVVKIEISGEALQQLKLHRRNLTGRTGCGLCGTEALEHAIQNINPVTSSASIDATAIFNALNQLQDYQPLQQLTGSVHGTAWVDLQGNIQLCREDVGRHNALDKLIGACVKNKIDFNNGFLVISSRASYEMIQKSGRCGIGIVVAVSAPTTLATDIANAANMMLVGFARDKNFVIYSHPEKLQAAK